VSGPRRDSPAGAAFRQRWRGTVPEVSEPNRPAPAPWRPRGFPPGDPTGRGDAGDPAGGDTAVAEPVGDRTQVTPLADPTLVSPVPVPRWPPGHPPNGHPPGGYPPGAYGPPPYGPSPAPPRRRRGLVAGVVLCAGLVLIVVLLAQLLLPKDRRGAGPSTTRVATAPVETTVTAPPTTVVAGASPDDPAPLGTEVEAAKGWRVRVTKVDLDANAEMARASWLARPGRGRQYVIVSVVVTHDAAKPAVLSLEAKAAMVGPSGASSSPSLIQPPGNLSPFAEVPAKGTVQGSLAFEVAKADVPGLMLKVEPTFTLDGAKDQRYLALR
jgi:hypothetical protein